MIEVLGVMPITIESYIFGLIPGYKDNNFKSLLAIAKDRPKEADLNKEFKI